MRYSDIKSSIQLAENKTANAGLEAQHAMHDLDAISLALPNISPEKGKEQETLLVNLKKISSTLQKFLDRVKGKAQQQPALQPTPQATDPNATVEAVADNQKKLFTIKDFERTNKECQETVNLIKEQIKTLNDLPEGTPGKEDVISRQTKILDHVLRDFENLKAQRDSAAAERDEAINFVKEVTGVLVTLGNKVQGFREDEDLEDFSSKERAAYKKMAVNAQKFTKTLKQALFGKILDMQEGSDVTGQEIKEFLEACVRGDDINMLDVIQQPQGNIKNHVNPKYQKVFDVFVEENIFSYAPGTTSGAIGPGEMALSMMGNPAEKGKKGDLKIGDEEVEIKASAKTGGRFNSKSIAKATTGWAIWAKGINQIMQNAPEDATVSVTQKDGSEKLVPAREYNGNRYNVIKNKAKEGSKYNWNSSGLKNLNIEVLQPYANKRETYELFESTIKALVQNYDKLSKPATNRDGTPNEHHKPFNPGELIADAVKDDGTIDIEKMNIAYSKIAYASYHLADGITTVMLLRTDNLNYVIFRDADDLVQQMAGNKIATGGGFNWNDDQQTPTPGYIAKA